ncbi:MAG: hypothetical protein ABI682_10140 [Acidobacteriota bacterium]
MNQSSHLPHTGESFELKCWGFEVAAMDERRVDKILVSAFPSLSQASGRNVRRIRISLD